MPNEEKMKSKGVEHAFFRNKSPVKGNLINANGYVDRREIKKEIIIVGNAEGDMDCKRRINKPVSEMLSSIILLS